MSVDINETFIFARLAYMKELHLKLWSRNLFANQIEANIAHSTVRAVLKSHLKAPPGDTNTRTGDLGELKTSSTGYKFKVTLAVEAFLFLYHLSVSKSLNYSPLVDWVNICWRWYFMWFSPLFNELQLMPIKHSALIVELIVIWESSRVSRKNCASVKCHRILQMITAMLLIWIN